MRPRVSSIARRIYPQRRSVTRKSRGQRRTACRLRVVPPRGVIVGAPFSILNEDGSSAAEYAHAISDEDLGAVLDLFVLNRILDRRLLMLQRQGRLGFWMTSRGEEATILGAAMALNL